jgi:hypothetical protein
MEHWLQGGPFLEVSFILENNSQRGKFIRDFLNKLKKIPQRFQIKLDNLDNEIDKFSRGDAYDKDNPDTYQIHSIEVPLLINISGERRSKLYFEEISQNTIKINFCFFGDKEDALEWNQKGIKDNEMPEFTKFLSSLYELFEFPIGAISVENEGVLLFFDCDETWPNECYKLSKINIKKIIKNINNPYIIDCIFDSEFFKLKDIPTNSKKIGKRGILIKK